MAGGDVQDGIDKLAREPERVGQNLVKMALGAVATVEAASALANPREGVMAPRERVSRGR